jgi:hypothetical protein
MGKIKPRDSYECTIYIRFDKTKNCAAGISQKSELPAAQFAIF